MTTKEVSNTLEFCVEVLKQFPRILSAEGANGYTFNINKDRDITIFNPTGDVCLIISQDAITIRDLFHDAMVDTLNQIKYEDEVKPLQALLEKTEKYDWMHDHVLETIAQIKPVPSITYTGFSYFNSEEKTFQEMTRDETVLPFEVYSSIQEIKDLVLKDLQKWIMG